MCFQRLVLDFALQSFVRPTFMPVACCRVPLCLPPSRFTLRFPRFAAPTFLYLAALFSSDPLTWIHRSFSFIAQPAALRNCHCGVWSRRLTVFFSPPFLSCQFKFFFDRRPLRFVQTDELSACVFLFRSDSANITAPFPPPAHRPCFIALWTRGSAPRPLATIFPNRFLQ